MVIPMGFRRVAASAFTGFRYAGAAGTLLRPDWWLNRQLNPHNDRQIFRRRRDAAWFRLDTLAMNVLDRPAGRRRWLRALEELPPVQPAPSRPVDELPASEEGFRALWEEYLPAQRPVVIRGLLSHDPDYVPWDFADFIRDYADTPVSLTCPVKDGYPGRLKEVDVPGVYLHNAEGLLYRHPELLQRAGFALLPRTVARNLRFSGIAQLFAGRKQTGTWWHCAGGMNLFGMLAGTKRWTLVDPADSPLMIPWTGGPGRSVYYISHHGAASPAYGKYRELLALAPEEAPELYTRAFAHANRFIVDLEPGDVLLIPAWWWHDVENTSPSSIGLATRWMDPRQPKLANPTFDIATRLHPGYYGRLVQAVANQDVVDRDGTVHFDRFRKQQPVVESNARAAAMDQYVPIDADVAAYYARYPSDSPGSDAMAENTKPDKSLPRNV
jgi:hypothetical protein